MAVPILQSSDDSNVITSSNMITQETDSALEEDLPPESQNTQNESENNENEFVSVVYEEVIPEQGATVSKAPMLGVTMSNLTFDSDELIDKKLQNRKNPNKH